MTAVLGVDFGGVIKDNNDTQFLGPDYLKTAQVPDSFEVLKRLNNSGLFLGTIHVVSKIGESAERKIRHWLEYHNFHNRTGILPSALHFCRERYQKAKICRELDITHFVDDRLEVLGYLDGVVAHRFLFQPRDEEVVKHQRHMKGVIAVYTWPDLEKLLVKEGVRA